MPQHCNSTNQISPLPDIQEFSSAFPTPDHSPVQEHAPSPPPLPVTSVSQPIMTPIPGVKRFPPQSTNKRRGIQPTARNTYPNCTTIRYNRRNNPDLEKRRTHYCNVPGMVHYIFYLHYISE